MIAKRGGSGRETVSAIVAWPVSRRKETLVPSTVPSASMVEKGEVKRKVKSSSRREPESVALTRMSTGWVVSRTLSSRCASWSRMKSSPRGRMISTT